MTSEDDPTTAVEDDLWMPDGFTAVELPADFFFEANVDGVWMWWGGHSEPI